MSGTSKRRPTVTFTLHRRYEPDEARMVKAVDLLLSAPNASTGSQSQSAAPTTEPSQRSPRCEGS